MNPELQAHENPHSRGEGWLVEGWVRPKQDAKPAGQTNPAELHLASRACGGGMYSQLSFLLPWRP